MILIDFSQLVIATAVQYHVMNKEQIDLPLLRHIALNTILNNKDKLKKFGPEVVLCMDGRNYWRKEVFPLYKGHRKEAQKKDTFDWSGFFSAFNDLKIEFKENLPYKCIEVDRAEADDIIAVLSEVYSAHEPVVIVSSDNDFLQLSQKFKNVHQYSPYMKKMISDKNDYSLFEHVIRGDAGDGIPNIFSDADTLMTEGKRQTPIQVKKLEVWRQAGLTKPEEYCTSTVQLERFAQNLTLIDLSKIPDDIKASIRQAYDDAPVNPNKLFSYLTKNKLMKILERGNF